MAENIWRLLPAFKQFQLIYVALRIGIPGALGGGSKSLRELSELLEVPEYRLSRVLRGLIWAEAIAVDAEGRFSLTSEASCLTDSSPTSISSGILFQGTFFYSAWGHLAEYLKNGAIPFERAHGCRLFDRLASEPALAKEFNSPMADRTIEYVEFIARLPAFAGTEKIVDIGAGEGQLVLGILKRRAACSGVVFDLAIQRSVAAQAIESASLSDRCRFESGDMFAAVPKDGDVYLLKWVLHDWSDEMVTRILEVLRRDIPSASQIMIIERLMPESITGSLALVQADLNMLVLNGGAERSLAEYQQLLERSGFRLKAVDQIEQNYGFYALTAEVGVDKI